MRNRSDGDTISKYLPLYIDDVLGPGIQEEGDDFTPPAWLTEE
jgi:hypothetical protein